MKFFTIDLWMALQEGPGGPALDAWEEAKDDYEEHLARIHPDLPAGVRAFIDSVSLHDANLRELTVDLPAAGAEMTLHGDDGSGGGRLHFVKYTGLVAWRTLGDPAKGLPGPGGYGDFGYEEFDRTDDGHTEHRILFSSGIELNARFRDLEYYSVDG